jgi:hypothetical protein
MSKADPGVSEIFIKVKIKFIAERATSHNLHTVTDGLPLGAVHIGCPRDI